MAHDHAHGREEQQSPLPACVIGWTRVAGCELHTDGLAQEQIDYRTDEYGRRGRSGKMEAHANEPKSEPQKAVSSGETWVLNGSKGG